MPRALTTTCLLFALGARVAYAQGPGPSRSEVDESTDAESPAPFGARATARRRADDVDRAAAATTVRARDRQAADAQLEELLFEVPGAHVVRTGGLGSFQSLALRGGEFGHTRLVLDEIPLSGPDTGLPDLSVYPLAAFERVEVYRGGAPLALGGGAIGGVLRLVPREDADDALSLSLAGGSFGAWRVDASASAGVGRTRFVGAVGLRGSRGDYPYLDDNATAFDPSDDQERRRRNADATGGHTLLHLRSRVRGTDLDAVFLGTTLHAGVPGAGATRALHAHRRDARLVFGVGARRRVGRARLHAWLASGTRRHRFDDRQSEVGSGFQSTDDRTRFVQARLATTLRLASVLDGSVLATYRRDVFRPDNALGPEERDSHRDTLAGAAELRLHGQLGRWHLSLRSSARVEHSRTEAHENRPGVGERTFRTDTTRPTFRAAVEVAPRPAFAFVGSVSSGTRLPSMLELFGNRGALVANPELIPERGRSVDGGVILRGARGAFGGSVEARAFHLRIDDLIRYRPISNFTAKAENVSGAQVRGLEAGTRARLGPVGLVGTLTWLRSETDQDAELNLRPRLRAQLQPSVHLVHGAWEWVAFADVVHRGAFFQDPANLVELPARTWLGAGARVSMCRAHGTWSLGVTVRDLLDARGQDLLGYPLPGRRVAIDLRFRAALDAAAPSPQPASGPPRETP